MRFDLFMAHILKKYGAQEIINDVTRSDGYDYWTLNTGQVVQVYTEFRNWGGKQGYSYRYWDFTPVKGEAVK